MNKKKFVIECTDEQLDDLKSVIDYVMDTQQDDFDEWLQEEHDEEDMHIYAMATNASRIEYKELV